MNLIGPDLKPVASVPERRRHAMNWRVSPWVVLISLFMSACSNDDSGTASIQVPTRQPVANAEIDKLLAEGDLANHQLADQLKRLSLPFGGSLSLELNLAQTRITDEQLKTFTLPASLTRVDLSNTLITDEGVAHLASGVNITELILVDTKITRASVAHLRAMPNLRTVNLHNTDIPYNEKIELMRFLKNRPH